MDSKDSGEEQDPDYATVRPTNSIQQKLIEETAHRNASRKITAIIEKEFSTEIDSKEKEILLIQNRLQQALKSLHFLRYVIITDFYNKKQCVIQPPVDSKQTRIHPAIKQVIGKASKSSENTFSSCLSLPSTSKDIPKISNVTESQQTHLVAANHLAEAVSQAQKKDETIGTNKRPLDEGKCSEPPKKIPRYIPPKSGVPEPPTPSRGDHYKVSKRIVLGSKSKWIPPEWRESRPSHKWCVYVQGSKENPDISEFVKKVRFLLHPSYRPNDIVDVTGPSFHLERYGWGQFRIRVQMHFKNPATKPVDLFHDLILDTSYTGVYIANPHTIIDLTLNTFPSCNEVKSLPEPENNVVKVKKEVNDDDNSCYVYFEHDYANLGRKYHKKVAMDEENITIAHSPPEQPEQHHYFLNNIVHKTEEDLPIETIVKVPPNKCISFESPVNGLKPLKVSNGYSDMNGQQVKKSVDPKTLALALDNTSSKFQPLKINIPSEFESLKIKKPVTTTAIKQIVVVNDKKVTVGNNNENKRTLDALKPYKGGYSLLKNSNNIMVNSKTNSMLNIKFNPSKSLLLEAESNVPALQLADPMVIQRLDELQVNEKRQNNKLINTESSQRASKSKLSYKEKPASKKEYYESMLRTIENVKIADTEALCRFIVRRLPIFTDEVSNVDYRKIHPYACKDEKEFLNSNVGKQRAIEWYRARVMRTFLKKSILPDDQVWSVKEIMMWCRIRGHTPFRFSIPFLRSQASERPEKPPEEFSETCFNSYTESTARLEIQRLQFSTKITECDTDEIIDVERIDDYEHCKAVNKADRQSVQSDLIYLEPPDNILSLHAFVCETSRQIGVKMGMEEVIPGVNHCAAGRVMVQAVECLMEDLLRSSFAKAWERSGDGSAPGTITLKDVLGVISSREEFEFFTNSGLESQPLTED